jgi:hypothetical protein
VVRLAISQTRITEKFGAGSIGVPEEAEDTELD